MNLSSALEFSPAELIITGFSGKTLSAGTVKNILQEGFTHFILFAHNYESKEQLIALTDDVQALARSSQFASGMPFVVSTDQEGGRVARFRDGFTILPPAGKVGDKGSPNFAFELAKVQARELHAAGIQLNYAPVCDINTNPKNPVIGDRAYGSQEGVVTRMATASVRGHLLEKVEPCIKHFPGHGDTHLDSHLSLPEVNTPLETLKTREWVPFHKAMRSGARYLMSAHVMLPHIDPQRPGTFSSTFLKTYVRGNLMYQGAIISDDMEMGAVTSTFGKEEAPVLALQAGCDLLCYRTEEQSMIALDAIRKGIDDGRLDVNELRRSIERTRTIRKDVKLAQATLSQQDRLMLIGHPDHQKMVQSFQLG
ncbi:MAG: beta-N-acetylhexosaminidase [Bdellovibrionales bacterium]|nr:beta-N-acetylhexosaminidase [Bdellovibrionales bacterium]